MGSKLSGYVSHCLALTTIINNWCLSRCCHINKSLQAKRSLVYFTYRKKLSNQGAFCWL